MRLPFAERGPWSHGEINAPLFEAALDYSTARGPARLLLASVAALADEERVLADITTEELCRAAGLADKSYRRARHALLNSGELILLTSGGGRGKANRWELADPRLLATARRKPERARRVPPPAGARPLLTPVARRDPATSHDAGAPVAVELPREANPGQDQTLPAVNPGQDRTLPAGYPGQDRTLLAGYPGQDRTVLDPETPAETPAQTPAPNARAGRNPRTPEPERHPPNPPAGGSSGDSITIEETFVTDRGRRRPRRVTVDLEAVRRTLGTPGAADLATWARIRRSLLELVGESTFAIWLDGIEVIAIDADAALVLDIPQATRGWVTTRFGRAIEGCAKQTGCTVRFANDVQAAAVGAR